MLLITFLFYQSSSSGTCLARAGVIFWDWNWNLKRSSQRNRMRVQMHEFAQSLRLNIDSRVSYGSPLRPDEKCRSSGLYARWTPSYVLALRASVFVKMGLIPRPSPSFLSLAGCYGCALTKALIPCQDIGIWAGFLLRASLIFS